MKKVIFLATLVFFFSIFALTPETVTVPTAAVLNFESRSREAAAQDAGKSVAELLTVSLMEKGCADLVERAELDKALTELHISAMGLTDRASQVKLGRFIGAKILISGSLFKVGGKNYLVAKLIGTETTRVLGASVSSSANYTEMVPELASKLAALLENQSAKLLPGKSDSNKVFAALAPKVKGSGRKVFVKVKEDIQVFVPDPAAETELKKLMLALGFEVVANRSDADFAIVGEALAANAGTFRNFTSASARIELSVYNKKGQLLSTGAVRETLAGGSYVIAAKEALAQAALRVAGEVCGVMK